MFPITKRTALARLFISLALPTAILSLSIQQRQVVPMNANQTMQQQTQNSTKIPNNGQLPIFTDNAMSGSVVWSTENTPASSSEPKFGSRRSKPLQRANHFHSSPFNDDEESKVVGKQRLKVAESFDDGVTHQDQLVDNHQQFDEKCDKNHNLEQEEHEVYQIPVKKVEKHHHHHHHHHHHAKKNKKPAQKEPMQLEIELKGNIKSKKKEPAVVVQKQEKVVKVASKKVAVKKSKKKIEEPVPVAPQQQQQEDDGGEQARGHQVEDQVSLIGEGTVVGSDEQEGSQQKAPGDEGSSSMEDRETEGAHGGGGRGGRSGGHQELMGHEINTSHVPGHETVVQDDGGGYQVVQEEEQAKKVAAEEPVAKVMKKKKEKKKEIVPAKAKVEQQPAAKQVEEKKAAVVAEQPKVVVAEPAKVEEPKKEEHQHKKHHSKHAHIELHAHKHFEQHQHINVHPPTDLGGGDGQVENELPINHHIPEEVYHEKPIHNHMSGHHQHEELEHIAQYHGDGGGSHHGVHELPLKEEWVAPNIHELPGHKQHVPGAFVIEDHSALEQQPHQPMGLNYKEEVISHPHGFGLTPSGHGYMGAYSSPKSTHATVNATLNKSS